MSQPIVFQALNISIYRLYWTAAQKKVAVDAVGCKPDDWVICVGSSAAREAAGSKSYPSDLTIVGIIDHWDPETQQQISGGAK